VQLAADPSGSVTSRDSIWLASQMTIAIRRAGGRPRPGNAFSTLTIRESAGKSAGSAFVVAGRSRGVTAGSYDETGGAEFFGTGLHASERNAFLPKRGTFLVALYFQEQPRERERERPRRAGRGDPCPPLLPDTGNARQE